MRTVFLTIALILVSFILEAQEKEVANRKGFVIGLGIGGGAISVSDADTSQDFDKGQGALTVPNLKIGLMLNKKIALLLNTSGMIYSYNDYDRSFETILPSIQYWMGENWWLNGGIGLAIDMPALYDIKDKMNDDFNLGCGIGLSSGYELYKKDNFALDFQLQTTLGRTFLKGDGYRDAATISIGVGFNWY